MALRIPRFTCCEADSLASLWASFRPPIDKWYHYQQLWTPTQKSHSIPTRGGSFWEVDLEHRLCYRWNNLIIAPYRHAAYTTVTVYLELRQYNNPWVIPLPKIGATPSCEWVGASFDIFDGIFDGSDAIANVRGKRKNRKTYRSMVQKQFINK